MRSAAAAAVLFVTVALPAAPAHAASGTAENLVVKQCTQPGNCQQDVPNPGFVSGEIHVTVAASATYPETVTSLELQASNGGSWFCLRKWPGGTGRVERTLPWRTYAVHPGSDEPPQGCEGSGPWGDITKNEEYKLRSKIRDSNGGTTFSSVFSVFLNNPPEKPEWILAPKKDGDKTASPSVRFVWSSPSDDHVFEYLVVRVDDSGKRLDWPVKASRPGKNCRVAGTSSFSCTDKRFPSDGYGGTYEYFIFAYRTTQAPVGGAVGKCMKDSSKRCIESSSSSVKAVTLNNPPPPSPTASSPSPTQTAAERERSRQRSGSTVQSSRQARDFSEFYEGEFTEELPFGDPGSLGPTGRIFGSFQGGESKIALVENFYPQDRDPTPYRAAAGGILLVLVAAHMARALRHGGHD